jgi:thiol-disulfide isomerase/thioredoxin
MAPTYVCEYCKKVLITRNERRNHVKQNHPEEMSKNENKVELFNGIMSNFCQYCTNVFKNISQYYEHARVVHKDTVQKYWISCPNCKKYFPTKKSLMIHKTNTCLDCEHCNKVLNSRNERRNHIEQNHLEEVTKCSACDKKFQIGPIFNAHCNKCRQNQVGCQICKEIFSTKEVMLAHARVMHVTHVELFWSSSCPDCKLTFPSMAEVEEHVCLVKLSSTKNDLNLDNIDVILEWLMSKETKRTNIARQNIEYQALLQY